ncbi:MAG: DegT/DnrJ/EryC1/StrS family aminotransferase [Thermoleophilaceae bacterium]
MKKLALVDLEAVWAELGDELEAAVLRVCRSHRYVGGDEITSFESDFASFLGAEHVIGVANGTDAIELALRALGIGPGDEVLVPANTFIATAEAVSATGAAPRFVDVEEESGLIDLGDAAARLTPVTRAVIPVHLYGRMVDMAAVMRFAAENDLMIVEDAAQAHGARRDGRSAGTVGHVGCFSFYPGKNLGALGDAGAAVTGDARLAEQIRLLRDHGRAGRDVHVVIGRNSRLDPMQAAVLSAKLPHLERWTEARRAAAAALREKLPAQILDPPVDEPTAEVHHLFPVLLEGRDELAEHLREAGIMTGVHYRTAMPDTPAFAGSGEPCLAARERARRQLSLPMHPHLASEDLERITTAVGAFAAQAGTASPR